MAPGQVPVPGAAAALASRPRGVQTGGGQAAVQSPQREGSVQGTKEARTNISMSQTASSSQPLDHVVPNKFSPPEASREDQGLGGSAW